MANGTYVYCVIAAPRRPAATRLPRGPKGTGPVRLLEVGGRGRLGLKRWLVVADAPLREYGEKAIEEGLKDLDWVARAAVAHERVVEAFLRVPALLPMKLFTIFASDERAVEHIASERTKIDALLDQVRNREEWGVRVRLDRAKAPAASVAGGEPNASGADYLARKKALRDAAIHQAGRRHTLASEVYERLGSWADASRRRRAGELPPDAGPLLLDAVFLVARSRAASFQGRARREAEQLAGAGLRVELTGPWPPYSFVGD